MKITKYKEASSLWLTYKDDLNKYVLKRVKNEDLADELSSEILMKVYKSCCSDIEIRNVRAWLYRIAHNAMMDHYRKAARTTHKLPEVNIETDEAEAYKEAAQLVQSLIELLPPKYSTPLKMADILGVKQAEIARELDLSLPATKSRVQRARKLLREKIIECCNVEISNTGSLLSLRVKQSCEPLKTCEKQKRD